MLEKMPRVLGEALSGLKAGLDGTTYLSEFPGVAETIRVGSEAFADRAALPPRFTADGEGVSPPLSWDGLPTGTVSVVVIVEDAGSPTPRPLVHLLAWNLDPAASLPEGATTGPTFGKNSFMKTGWLPKGTHNWEKFVKPDELAAAIRSGGLDVTDTTGVVYNPLTDGWRMGRDTAVNYMLSAARPA